ncbi:NAD-dependent epimerase/dehydratase family protein [Marinomonas sp. ef1]|jgi:nucleoside-diphosphate-sugar epimerase|uniref:NAD-dependent epimerase/dehydratase family protein n=1 Tax=Marinomonas sp. ef1 TaxID=2005043 RepID=UPI000C29229C|nr:NAD-dependent epimerase/dehydratase family protein [Marinomonas sp. ef1]
MKIFISGVTGYVGRNVARHLAQSHEIVGLSRDTEKAKILKDTSLTFVYGDLHRHALRNELKDCDIVIHTAADTDHKNLSKNQYKTNVDGTAQLLTAAKVAGVKRFIHISTDSVVLTGKPMKNVSEDASYPKKSVGDYSHTKQLAERIALNANCDAFTVIVLRPRFVWGRDDTTAMPQILKAIENQTFSWIGGGHYLSSTTHIANLCHAVEASLYRGTPKEIYFISDGDDRPFRETISGLIEAHGLTVPDKNIPGFIPLVIAKLDSLRRRLVPKSSPLPVTFQEYATSAVEVTLDITKAKQDLSYRPIMTFQAGLDELKTTKSTKQLS